MLNTRQNSVYKLREDKLMDIDTYQDSKAANILTAYTVN